MRTDGQTMYICSVYTLRVHTRIKVSLSRPQNQNLIYINRSISLYKPSCLYTHFLNELFPNTAFKQRQHVDAVGCHTVFFFSSLISMFVLDTLQIDS